MPNLLARHSYITRNEGVPMDELRRSVPAIFAEDKYHGTSAAYQHFSTAEVVDALVDSGWVVVSARSNAIRESRKDRFGFQRHMVTFRRASDIALVKKPEVLPEINLVNAHDATASFFLFGGLYRLICDNGLRVLDDSAFLKPIRLRHNETGLGKYIAEADNARMIAERAAEVAGEWKKIKLTPDERRFLVETAIVVRYGKEQTADRLEELVGHIGTARRPEDAPGDLWHVFNVVQDNAIKGGFAYVQGKTYRGKDLTRKARAVTRINGDLEINKALWTAATEIARHRSHEDGPFQFASQIETVEDAVFVEAAAKRKAAQAKYRPADRKWRNGNGETVVGAALEALPEDVIVKVEPGTSVVVRGAKVKKARKSRAAAKETAPAVETADPTPAVVEAAHEAPREPEDTVEAAMRAEIDDPEALDAAIDAAWDEAAPKSKPDFATMPVAACLAFYNENAERKIKKFENAAARVRQCSKLWDRLNG